MTWRAREFLPSINGGTLTATGGLTVYSADGNSLTLSGGTINAGTFSVPPSEFDWTAGTLDITNSSVEIDNTVNANLGSPLSLGAGQALIVSGGETVGGGGAGSVTQNGGSNTIQGPPV